MNTLIIKNFQSHKHTELVFAPGVNVIIGDTDSGKTAIIRALNWCIFNRPGGDAFRSSWGGETSVSIQIGNDTIIRRKGADNTYEFNGSIFKAFGQGIPEEIKKILNIDELNVQQQLDAPYLLSETPGGVASHFNKVAKLDIIDQASQNIQKEIRKINSDISYTREQIENYEQKIKAFPDLSEFEYELSLLKNKELQMNSLQNSNYEIMKIIKEIDKTETNIQKKIESIKDEEIFNKIEILYQEIKQKNTEYTNLKKLGLSIFYLQTDIEKKETLLIDEHRINKIQIHLKSYTKFVESQQDLKKLVYTITNIVTTLKSKETSCSNLEQDFKINFPNICPLCNSKIK
jgi:predicted ATP-dependent endonuclease of OLD family